MIAWLLAMGAGAAPVTVCASGCDFDDLATALDDPSADPITVTDSGTYALSGYLLTRSVQVLAQASNGARPVLDMTGGGNGLRFDDTLDVSFEGFDVLRRSNGWCFEARQGTIALTHMDFLAEPETVWVVGAHLRLFDRATGLVADSHFREASVGDYGSHIHANGSDLEIRRSAFSDGSGQDPQRGGSVSGISGSSVLIEDSTFEHMDNPQGGALHLRSSTATVLRTAFVNNHGRQGGDIWIENSTLSIAESQLAGSSADELGQSIYARSSTLVIDASSLYSSAAQPAIDAQASSIQISGSEFAADGPILFSRDPGGPATIAQSTFTTPLSSALELAPHPEPVLLSGNRFCGGGTTAPLVDIGEGTPTVGVLGNTFITPPSSDGMPQLWVMGTPTSDITVTGNTFLGQGAAVPALVGIGFGSSATVADNLFAYNTAGVGFFGGGFVGGASFQTNAFYANNIDHDADTWQDGGGNLYPSDNPLALLLPPVDCQGVPYLAHGSELHDAGSVGLDPDGSNTDIGALSHQDPDGDGWVSRDDCDESDPAVNPGAPEICNGIDDDCDGEVDSPLPISAPLWYPDVDEDGFGSNTGVPACSQPTGWVADDGDCDDGDPTRFPGAPEQCNGLDDDCGGNIDNGLLFQDWYTDDDQDGFGNALDGVYVCDTPAGRVLDNTDCNDAISTVHPNGVEACNNLDDDCNGSVDDNLVFTDWFSDDDGDGYGNEADTLNTCEASPPGRVTVPGDCVDSDAAIHPTATELCNEVDDDCNGTVDDNLTLVAWYSDADDDGYGNPDDQQLSCQALPGRVTDATDCNDAVAAVNPGAAEVCNGHDDNCDDVVDTDAIDRIEVWIDQDGDGWGEVSELACDDPGGARAGGDCDGTDPSVHPGQHEVIDDGVDNDCRAGGGYSVLSSGAPCGCSSEGGGSAWLLVMLPLLVRRRGRVTAPTY